MTFQVGQRVKILKIWKNWIGEPKYPGRTGTVKKLIHEKSEHPLDENLYIIDLDETTRSLCRDDSFFERYLESVQN